jgi:D-serine deaminase-like pyridoxal phosphate-dependent protein
MTTLDDLDTPSVTILLDRLESNISRAQRLVAARGIANRPHIKTHKIPAIGRMQMEAGAVGLTCQKLSEAEAFIRSKVCDDILLSFNIVGRQKTERLIELSEGVRRLAVVADNETVITGLAEAGRRHGREIPLLIECDTGFGRNGAQSPEAVRELARFASDQAGVRFEGLMTFPNKAPDTCEFLSRALELCAEDRIEVPIVSGGGTPALKTLGDFPMMTEHRAGTYVFNDVMMMEAGFATLADCAMHVRTTVVSTPTPDRAIVDAGSKVLTHERYYVEHFGRVVEYPDAIVVRLSEEHGVIDFARSARKPKVGEVISIIPNHCCVVSNMVDEVYGVRDGNVDVVWPVTARGATR